MPTEVHRSRASHCETTSGVAPRYQAAEGVPLETLISL